LKKYVKDALSNQFCINKYNFIARWPGWLARHACLTIDRRGRECRINCIFAKPACLAWLQNA
jgi:hypothetical protein